MSDLESLIKQQVEETIQNVLVFSILLTKCSFHRVYFASYIANVEL